ncbi:porin family protein [Phragmitibacter flavus]|uniref:Porin family protein n=1 Tax=Phragmitibacter flavus TaxID=2576071 RepID=A0A5R8KAL4_9BACT|nr:outer membrane beta-barrel protein [Phragmitibacter flavus]TLD69346.1 porin family protein [Phragmitibacter flavus]
MKLTTSLAAFTSLLVASAISTTTFGGETASAKMEAMTMAPTEPPFSWTGFYLGVQVGAAFNPSDDDGVLDFDTDLDGSYGDRIAAFGDNFEGNFDESLTFGAHAGYDFQIDRFVIGFLADINKTDVSQEQSGFSSTPAFYTEKRELDYLVTGRLRAGYLITDRFLAYVTGGLAYGDVEYSYLTDTPATVRSRNEPSDSDNIGYAFGGGLEARITRNISMTVEYLYTDLGDSDYVTNLSGPAAFSARAGSTDSRGSDRDFDFHTLQVKLSYRF